ncbi:hypothetical protein LOK49_LG12G01607 [Camellia lanceoleosa]|uniref:Uncharacterized protein n=1 Tax=Camellia lanceoleosa TaxID=1840588 RepID=A0ACC0FTJ8_9ERIC|nr:hypothetical protein LOK49_LG12G01607 [Camellia lanceoleosa]
MEVIVLRSKLALLFLFAACAVFPSIQATDIKYCNKKANYIVKVDDVEISPYPVATGNPTTFTIKASTDQVLTGGKLSLAVSYFGVKVHSETHNICEKTSCPISVGKFVLSHTQTLPALTPPGSYTLKMKMQDEKKHELTCISFKFDIELGSFMSI